MPGPLKVGIIGIGQRGLQHVEHLSGLQADEEVRLVALADPYPENLDEQTIQTGATSYRQGETTLYDATLTLRDGRDRIVYQQDGVARCGS